MFGEWANKKFSSFFLSYSTLSSGMRCQANFAHCLRKILNKQKTHIQWLCEMGSHFISNLLAFCFRFVLLCFLDAVCRYAQWKSKKCSHFFQAVVVSSKLLFLIKRTMFVWSAQMAIWFRFYVCIRVCAAHWVEIHTVSYGLVSYYGQPKKSKSKSRKYDTW